MLRTPFLLVVLVSACLLAPSAAQAADACPDEAPASLPAACVWGVPTVATDFFQVGVHVYAGADELKAHIEYGTTDQYGSSTGSETVGANTDRGLAFLLENLDAGTVYHYRLVVETAGGSPVWTGDDHTMPTAPAPPVNLAAPSLLGFPYPGQTLVCDPGVWSRSVGFDFIWERNGEAVAGNGSPSYVVGEGDVGSSIGCTVKTSETHVGPASASATPVTIVPRPRQSVSGSGARACVVPKLARKSLAKSRSALSSAGCKTGRVTYAWSSTVPKGSVVRSTPAAGRTLASGAKVALVVSKGKKKR